MTKTAPTMTKTAIGYVRVSTVDQAEHGLSLAAQREKLRSWCEANGYTLAAVYADEGISGKTIQNRDGLQTALKSVTTGTALVCCSMTRLARSTKDMLTIAEQLEKRGADLVSLTEKIDTTSAAGRMVFRLMAVLSEFERDLTSERTAAVLKHKRMKREVYAPVPFGFQAVAGRLVEVDQEGAIVAEMNRLRCEGQTLQFIADTLNQRGVRPKQGGACWYPSSVAAVLRRYAADRDMRSPATLGDVYTTPFGAVNSGTCRPAGGRV